MFLSDFHKLKHFKEKLKHKFKRDQKIMNQTVSIRDLFVYPESAPTSFGELIVKTEYSTPSSLVRLIDHTESLAQIANAYHQKYYCQKNADGSYSLKKDCKNKITRILLNEFSLYTDKALSLEEFAAYMDAVYKIAEKQQPNVHLLLSSIAVRTNDNKLLNVTLYVQCGKEPKIETLCKARRAKRDPSYPDVSRFSQQAPSEDVNISEYIGGDKKGITITNNSTFTVKTEGGAQYQQAIDVCIDHDFAHSQTLMNKKAKRSADYDTTIIPDQIDHLLTSNSLRANPNSVISESVVQIDPDPEENRAILMKDDLIGEEDLDHIKKESYQEMSITAYEECVTVSNPPFGYDYDIIATEERKLGGFNKELKPFIEEHNRQVIEHQIKSKLDQKRNHKKSAKEQRVSETSEIEKKLDDLYGDLDAVCKGGFLEKLFRTQNYKLKLEARTIIQESIEETKKFNQDPEVLRSCYLILLRDIEFKFKNLNHGVPCSLSKKLNGKIYDAMMQLAFDQTKQKLFQID